MRTLIVIDMQNDFINMALGTPEAQAIVPNVKKKIEEYDAREDAIVFTRDTHFDNYLETSEGKNLPVKHCIMDTRGWQIADGLELPHARYINKPTFGWMGWKSLVFEPEDEIEIERYNECVNYEQLWVRMKGKVSFLYPRQRYSD